MRACVPGARRRRAEERVRLQAREERDAEDLGGPSRAGQGCAANTCDAEARDLDSSRAEKRVCPAASPERDECHAEDLALQQAHTAYS